MNVFNNPYNEMLNPNVDFSDGYFDAIVNSIKNKGLLLAMLEKGKDDVEGSVDFLWNFLPIKPGFKVGCNEEQAKNVLRYLINNA